MTPGRVRGAWRVAAAVALLVSAGAIAQPAPAAVAGLPRGEIVDGLASASDPSQTYAIYFPTTYTPDRPAPLLLIFDPRSRGRFAAELFVPAAEKFGWVLASSNGTRSDITDNESNRRAIAAMYNDVFNRARIDPKRLYASGFSGGARMAVDLALVGKLAGVIATGAGFPIGYEPAEGIPFAFIGIIGRRDFNVPEMTRLDRRLDRLRVPHALRFFEGGHAWPPPDALLDAVEWQEIQAMKRGLRPLDEAMIAASMERRSSEASTLESSSDLAAAAGAWQSIAADFTGLADVSFASDRAARLLNRRDVRNALARSEKRDEEELAARRRDRQYLLAAARRDSAPPALQTLLRQLEIDALKARAAKDDLSAARRLEAVFAQAAMVILKELLDARENQRALLMLQVAETIRPEAPYVHYNIAAVNARLGRIEASLAALERALRLGFADRGLLEGDPDFEPMRDGARFRALLAALPLRQ